MRPNLYFRCLDSANYRIFVVYVERQGESTFFVPRDDGLHLLGITRGNRRAPTAVENLPGDLMTKTRGAAGDEPDGSVIL